MARIIFPSAVTLPKTAAAERSGKHVGELQMALQKLNPRARISKSDIARKELGDSTVEAVRAFQKRAGVQADGKITPSTVALINAELAHSFVTNSKTRTQRLHTLLQESGHALDPAETKSRHFGPKTEKALREFQAKVGMPETGRISPEVVDKLHDQALKTSLSSKSGIAQTHRTLLRALNIAKLKDVRVDHAELRERKLGRTTQTAVKALQTKYGLEATGEIDVATMDRIASIATSVPQPTRKLRARTAAELTPLKKAARLNMTGEHVATTQSALAFLGYSIDESEFKSQSFGKTTREAVLEFQRSNSLPMTGFVSDRTLVAVNNAIKVANPTVAIGEYSYRVRGTVRDELWKGMSGVTVQVFEKLVSGTGEKLAERQTGSNGFVDIPYNPPTDSATKQTKRPFHLQVKAIDTANEEIGSKTLFNPTQIAWANFTKGDQPYRGTSEFQFRTELVEKSIGDGDIADLKETSDNRQVSHAAQSAGLSPDDVMRLVLAYLVSAQLDVATLGPEACYAYLGQNLPSTLTGDLLEKTQEWELIDHLVDTTADALVFMDDALKSIAFDNAVTLNLIPIAVGINKEAILAAFAELKQAYVLEKPILIGNASLQLLLESTDIDAAHYASVGAALLTYKSFGTEFWADVESRPDDFGGADAIKDLKTTFEVGHVTKNFVPMLDALKAKIDDVAEKTLNSSRDLAKLTQEDWVRLIGDNGGQVPDNTDGVSDADKVETYAATMMSQSELLFPSVALVATVARSDKSPLTNVASVQKVMDENEEFDLRTMNVDAYVKKHSIDVDDDTLTEMRVLQRVHRIAPTAATGQALLDARIHSSSQIVAMGKDRFVAAITGEGQVDKRAALTAYGLAQFQYGQVLQRITDYRFDMHRADPQAIVDHTYTTEEMPDDLSAIPNLETLFGSLDYCSCDHCESVYGPAAYLADLLRWLGEHPSEDEGKNVDDVLLERRPDLGNIKLNCDNTETPLPYIDLVCEVLENAIPAPDTNLDFDFQTTKTAAELRAAPENVRAEAYDKLRAADFPFHVAFDLWQEQARVFLEHLGVHRWELMEAFQTGEGDTAQPTDESIAGEYWGMSSHETAIVTAPDENTAAMQRTYWGITTAAIPDTLTVEDFMHRTQLTYDQLLELLYVKWINPDGDPDNVYIDRPNATCDTTLQKVSNLDEDRLDKIHRFLRLRSHVSWAMWELDLLIRCAAVGDDKLDDNCLVRMMQVARLQKRLGLSVERTLVLFADVNSETRVKPAQPDRTIPSLYENLFLNQAVINPVDTAFTLPIAGGVNLSEHTGTVLAAFSLSESDFTLLADELPDDVLSVSNLSKLGRYTILARAIGLSVTECLTLIDVMDDDVFATPEAMLDFIEQFDWIGKAGYTVDELDYLLAPNAESATGIRDEVITQYVDSLRDSLRADSENNPDGIVASQVATALSITPDQAQPLLVESTLGAKTFSDVMQDDALLEQDDDGEFVTEVTPENFPDVYTVFKTLHKAALVTQRCELDASNLTWLIANASKFSLLQPNALPLDAAPAESLFPAWLSLVKWVHFKDAYPEPEDVTLRDIFDKADDDTTTKAEIVDDLASLTQWDTEETDLLVAELSLQHAADSDFADIDTYLALEECMRICKRAGVTATKVAAWANRDDDTDDAQATTAQEVRQAAKSKYDDATWLTTVTPLEDALREKKRDALIAYLVGESSVNQEPEIEEDGKTYPNPLYWEDSNDLLKYFLIDVEMSACQLTSRIKQAISSTQMFVHRCLLGLEQPRVEVSRMELLDTASDNSWKQWEWMRSYRIWEANRKVFLYPENWIEPELRDDKSPFFDELESEIVQSDMTDENVEVAFRNYLHKVHEVARLDIVGAYYEYDNTNTENDDELEYDVNILHVIGRTRAHPATYYYRTFDLNYGAWTAWERIDLDIQSDQVVPVIYNRRLYLFWLNILEKPQKVKKMPAAKAGTSESNSAEPPNQLEIQLCWSGYRDGAWSSKQMSSQKLIHPWQRPLHSYNLKPRYKSRENLLWLDIYISQSQEFNSTKFWDAYKSENSYVTQNTPFTETSPPWHSSSFVFDGGVVDVKMKALTGQYHVVNNQGEFDESLTVTTSLKYVNDNFGAIGRAINELSGAYEIAPRLPLPELMHYENTQIVNNRQTLNRSTVNVLENSNSRTLLSGGVAPFELVVSQHTIAFDTYALGGSGPFFYQDNQRAFFIRPEWQDLILGYNQTYPSVKYNIYPFYHPYTALFMRELNRLGVEGLLNRTIQIAPETYYPFSSFNISSYAPSSACAPDETVETECVDFERYGAYSIYNWEIFFHAPLMIACRLSQNQRFDEAMRWFHFIFDPTNTETADVPQRYWITRPFYETSSEDYRAQRIENLLANIDDHMDELRAWKNDPFNPHLIARYRPVAYQKTVVMKYIDNLIAWGDQLFRQDTIESINEATTLYILAYELLGRRPVKVPNVEHEEMSYNELTASGDLDPFGNQQVEILMENFTGTPVRVTRTESGTEPLPTLSIFYFAIPNNDLLLGYWDTIENRLFNIRNCRNIEGVFRQLPLFEPPIDPALLVKAAAAGIDLSSVVSASSVAASPYRFRMLAQKALEFCGEVRAFGDKLLSALEKNDAEGLSLLRSTQEITMQQAVREIRKQQIDDAEEAVAGLEKSKELAEQKKNFYEGREFINTWEGVSLALGGTSAAIQTGLAIGYGIAAVMALIPEVEAGVSGFGGSPEAVVEPVDGQRFAKAVESGTQALSSIAQTLDKWASLASTMGGYQRRQEDWVFQGELATTEIEQIEKQIAGAQIRLAIAERELENLDQQIEHTQATDEYMRNKYTNQQLYSWQIGQVSSVYFQSYQLAYDMAKRAEKCFQLERGDATAMFIQFGYWDSLKKGLMAGERLGNDIRRMEAAYLEKNTRDLEISKNISLAQVLPLALMALKEAGACTLVLPEWLFDMDYPGHYFRRIKSVSLSIPCVVGPYTSINGTLSLTNHAIRISTDVAAGYGDPLAANDTRFYSSQVPQTAIATSHGQNDSGMFELNFNDERYLPFEGAGAVSEWRLELPRENNQFDLATVSDVILHVRYTARSSGDNALTLAAKNNVTAVLPTVGAKLLVLNQEFSGEWYRFLNAETGQDQALSFTLGLEHLPFFARTKTKIYLTKMDLILEGVDDTSYTVQCITPGAAAVDIEVKPEDAYGERQHGGMSDFAATATLLGEWQLKLRRTDDADFRSLPTTDIKNAYAVLGFSAT